MGSTAIHVGKLNIRSTEYTGNNTLEEEQDALVQPSKYCSVCVGPLTFALQDLSQESRIEGLAGTNH